MNEPNMPNGLSVKAVLWGFLAGLPVGIFLGWSMHGLISFIVRFLLFIVCVVIIIGVVMVWRGSRKSGSRAGARVDIVDVRWRDPGSPGGGTP